MSTVIRAAASTYAGDVVVPFIFTGPGLCACYENIAHKLDGVGTLHNLAFEVEIFRQGTQVDMVYLIERGLIKLSHYSPGGRETLVGLRRPHWLLGAAPALRDRLRSVTATTLNPCTLRFITRQQFNTLLEDLAFSHFLNCSLSLEISSHIRRMIALAAMSGEERIIQLISEIISAHTPPCESNHEISLSIPLKQYQIAQILCMSPEHLSRLMRRLERRGLCTYSRGIITITRPIDFLEACPRS